MVAVYQRSWLIFALSKEETLSIYNDYVGFYDEFFDIEAYYRYKKRKRMEELPSSLLFGLGPEGDLFDNPDLLLKIWNLKLSILQINSRENVDKRLYNSFGITASFTADNSLGRSSRIKEKNLASMLFH